MMQSTDSGMVGRPSVPVIACQAGKNRTVFRPPDRRPQLLHGDGLPDVAPVRPELEGAPEGLPSRDLLVAGPLEVVPLR